MEAEEFLERREGVVHEMEKTVVLIVVDVSSVFKHHQLVVYPVYKHTRRGH